MLPRLAQWPLHIWFALVGVSVLTTYQHHFFDIPTGALLGVVLPVAVAGTRRKSAGDGRAARPIRRRLLLATRYLIGGSSCRRARRVDRWRGIVAAVAGRIAVARRRQLRRPWTGRVSRRTLTGA